MTWNIYGEGVHGCMIVIVTTTTTDPRNLFPVF